jgi:hypothetical protein
MAAVDSVAVGLVVLWLLLSIMHQVASLQSWLGRWDVLNLLPSWSFFAPSPANRDSHVVVRDLLADGTLGRWESASVFPPRLLSHLVWHPEKRPRKILRDAGKAIRITRRHATNDEVVQCSLPYLVVLHHCIKGHAPGSNAVARQFAIVETSGREDRRLWITFISQFHPL